MARKKTQKKKPPTKGSAQSPPRVIVDIEKIPSRVVLEGMPPVRDHLEVVMLCGKDVAYACGHTYAEEFVFDVYGFPCVAQKKHAKKTCGDCLIAELKRDAARCAVCHHVIFPGEGVALYAYAPDSFDPKNEQPWFKFVQHDEGRKSVIGCVRQACCPSGGFFAGNWTEEGFRSRFPGGMSIASHAMATGEIQVASTK